MLADPSARVNYFTNSAGTRSASSLLSIAIEPLPAKRTSKYDDSPYEQPVKAHPWRKHFCSNVPGVSWYKILIGLLIDFVV